MNNPAHVGLCGAGHVATAHAMAAASLGMPVVAVASRTPARAQALSKQTRARAVDYAQLPAGADIIVVCTPAHLRAADTLRLLDAGCAVVVEKPLCVTLSEADAIVAAAAVHNQRVLYAENLAYSPVVAALLNRVGHIGPLTHLEARTINPLPTWRDVSLDELGGGVLLDLGVHPLALMMLAAGAAGAGPVVGVSARLEEGDTSRNDVYAEVDLTFRSGLVGRVVASWKGEQPQGDLQMSSAAGVLRVDFWPEPTLEHNGEPVPLPRAASPLEQFGYVEQLRSFQQDLRRGATPFMDVAFGRLILEVVCAAYASAGANGTMQSVPFTGDRTKTPSQLWHRDE